MAPSTAPSVANPGKPSLLMMLRLTAVRVKAFLTAFFQPHEPSNFKSKKVMRNCVSLASVGIKKSVAPWI